MLKGIIQGPSGQGGGQQSGSGVTSVGLLAPAEFISGPPVTSAGNLSFDWSGTPIAVAHGGTGFGSYAANSILQAGPTSTAHFTSIPLNNLTSNFLRGDGVFAAPPPPPPAGAGTVTSVDVSLSSEFTVAGNPITVAGTILIGWRGPLSVAHGGTGMGSFGPGLIMGGLNSNAPLQGLPFTNLTSTYFRGDGTFAPTPAGPGGTVTSVDLAMSSEFRISGNPITGAGTLVAGFIQPLNVAHGGSGMGSFLANSILQAGLTSTGPYQSIALNNLTSSFLRGDGSFAPTPAGPGGTVTSVDLSPTSEFVISGNPVTGAGTLLIGWKAPIPVAHGGTGLGSVGIGAVLRGGLSSTGPLQGTPLTNLTSTFLDGSGNFSTPPLPSGVGGTVTSVALQLTSEFNITGSPITGAGTLMASFAFQSANAVLIGPSAGVPATPAFRQLVNADVPQALSGKTISSTTLNAPNIGQQLLVFGSTVSWNLNSGTIAVLTLDSTARGTLSTPANFPVQGGSAILKLIQGGTGFVFTYVSAFRFANNRTLPTMSSCPGQVDILSFYLDSSRMYGTGLTNLM